MGIGTSLGAHYDDELHWAASPWLDAPGETPDDNVQTLEGMQTNQQLSKVDSDVLGGTEVGYKPTKQQQDQTEINQNQAPVTFNDRFGTLPPAEQPFHFLKPLGSDQVYGMTPYDNFKPSSDIEDRRDHQESISDLPEYIENALNNKFTPAPPTTLQDNFQQANKDMNLTPEEQALYQRHLTNLWGTGGVDNANGSRSTLFEADVEKDGKIYNVPTVFDGKILQGKDLFDRLDKEGYDQFPSYDTRDEAQARYTQMHTYMEKDTSKYFIARQMGADDINKYGGSRSTWTDIKDAANTTLEDFKNTGALIGKIFAK